MICRSNTYPVQPVHDLDQSIDSDFFGAGHTCEAQGDSIF